MPDLDSLPPLRDIIRAHDLRAEKSLGQNFLLDLNLTAKIARVCGDMTGSAVFEIGPGPGGLTRALLAQSPAAVIAVEYDPRAIAALQSLRDAAGDKLFLVQQDALETDLPALAAERGLGPPYMVCANLPYNIATRLLTDWLERIYAEPALYSQLTLMFQKEVAQRIAAAPRGKAYGRLSVMCQWLCETKLMFDVPASAFTPPPKVTSSIVRLIPKAPAAERPPYKVMEEVVRRAFGQRRKMIRGSLKEYLPQIEICRLPPEARAEELSVADFERLARAIASV